MPCPRNTKKERFRLLCLMARSSARVRIQKSACHSRLLQGIKVEQPVAYIYLIIDYRNVEIQVPPENHHPVSKVAGARRHIRVVSLADCVAAHRGLCSCSLVKTKRTSH